MKKITVGIVLDYRFSDEEGGYSRYSYYAQRENMVKAFQEHANVILLPHDREAASVYAGMIDGLVFTGSFYHIDPFYYREIKVADYKTDNRRSDFEFEMLRRALDKRIPVLGIGGGMQVINVFFGGSMYQNVETEVPGSISHQQKTKGIRWHQPYHENTILPDTLLGDILGGDPLPVNSTHSQAVKKIGDGLKINALSKQDNIIEGIESESRQYWVMGIQWRPEYAFSRDKPDEEREKKLFDAFAVAAQSRKEGRR